MKILIRVSRIAYGIMMGGLAVQQIFYATFRPVILPPFKFTGTNICVYITSVGLILACLAIIFDKNARKVSLILGGTFLALFLFCQIPYEFMSDPYYKHFGSWGFALKELVFAGGGFIVAGSYPPGNEPDSRLITFLENFIPFGAAMMCITMISFGIDHFLYAPGVATLVPAWIPGAMFWTYFAGAALILSGVSIILRIQLKLSALLLALMIFLWFLVLHITRGIADPFSLQGNEISSVFESFGFAGIAYLAAYGYQIKPVFQLAAA